MEFSRLKHRFGQLGGSLQLVGIGSLLLAVATLLPWYADLDQFRVGDMFLGVTGPASFVGIAIFLLSIGSLGIFLAHLLEKRRPKLPVKESVFHLFVGVESLFLLLIVNSIYFHPKFGVNITLKESRFGMLLALIAGIALVIGGYLELKKEKKTDDYIGKLEPLVRVKPDMERTRPKPVASPPISASTPVVSSKNPVPSLERQHQPFSSKQGMVERAQDELSAKRHTQVASPVLSDAKKTNVQPELLSSHEELPDSSAKNKEGGSFMIRTDL